MGWHHSRLADALEKVERGEIKRLMVSMPPRHGKSEFSSVLFPCWALGRNPHLRIVQSGYSADIALTHSRHARDVFVSPEFQALFPAVHHRPGRESQRQIDVYRQAASEWGTAIGGSYYAVGVGGGLTGREFDIGLIDDPVKDREEANSERIRAKVLDWYRSTFYTRQSPEARIIVIMTRWHTEDLAGYLREAAKQGDGEQWTVIEFPAVRDGEYDALWPERFPAATLEAIKKAVGSHEWASLYQQQPVPQGGNRFKTKIGVHVHLHDSLESFPKGRYTRGWDLASSKKERDKDKPDFTWGVRGLVQTERIKAGASIINLRHVWINDAVYCCEEAPERNKLIVNTVLRDGPTVSQHIEAFGGYKDAYTTLKAVLMGVAIVNKSRLPGDKSAKLAPLEPVFEAGHIHMLKADWNGRLIQEFSHFPSGAHDDGCDATAVMFHSQIDDATASIANPYLYALG